MSSEISVEYLANGKVKQISLIAGGNTYTWKVPTMLKIIRALRTIAEEGTCFAEVSGTVEFGKDRKKKQSISIRPDDDNAEPTEYLIPRGTRLKVEHGDRVEKGRKLYSPPILADGFVWMREDGVYLTDHRRPTGEGPCDEPAVRKTMERFSEITGGARTVNLVHCWVMTTREAVARLANDFEDHITLAKAIEKMTRADTTDHYLAGLLRWGADLVERRNASGIQSI